MYGEDYNFIHAEPLRSRDKYDVMRAIERGLTLFATNGDVPTIWRINNVCSGEIKSYCAKHDIKLELAPPENHRTTARKSPQPEPTLVLVIIR